MELGPADEMTKNYQHGSYQCQKPEKEHTLPKLAKAVVILTCVHLIHLVHYTAVNETSE